MTDLVTAAAPKEFQAPLVVPLPDGGYGPADGNQLLALASEALAAIISRDTGSKMWRLEPRTLRHPKMGSAPSGVLDSVYFTGHASYRVAEQNAVDQRGQATPTACGDSRSRWAIEERGLGCRDANRCSADQNLTWTRIPNRDGGAAR
jgi:hypothetical protein